MNNLIELINAELPQFQCGRCDTPGCRPYAEEIVKGSPHNRCVPGGQDTLNKISNILGKDSILLDEDYGPELKPQVAHIIEQDCIGCKKCIDACPTDAIAEPYVVDGSKCISYFTIELKDAIPNKMKGKFDNWMFGCDICQMVCPWNSFSLQHDEEKFFAKKELLSLKKEDWEKLEVQKFDEIFEGSAVKRTGYNGLKRNIKFLIKSDQTPPE